MRKRLTADVLDDQAFPFQVGGYSETDPDVLYQRKPESVPENEKPDDFLVGPQIEELLGEDALDELNGGGVG